MIVVHESTATIELCKPVICRKCERGKLGNISAKSKAVLSKRGKLPSDDHSNYFQVKCPVCRKFWLLTIVSGSELQRNYSD